MKITLVYESPAARGGAERVVAELRRVFPEAATVVLPFRRFLLPLAAVKPETLDLSESDVIMTSSSTFAKGIVTRPSSLHLCYCHTPTRFLWDWSPESLRRMPPGTIRRALVHLGLHGLRLWDQAAAKRVDFFIANSETTRARIRKYYGRDAAVIYPPVDTDLFARPTSLRAKRSNLIGNDAHARSYFLFVGRLTPPKRADLAIQTFNKLGFPLVVVGEGREERRLRQLAGPTISFRGFVPDEELVTLYARARAVIFPSDDDFGLVPVEAMAAGAPVLALRCGGALETVIEGITGEFFDEPIEELLADCVRRFLEREGSYDPSVLRAHAARFSAERFRREVRTLVDETWAVWQQDKSATNIRPRKLDVRDNFVMVR